MANAYGLSAGRIVFELAVVGRQNVERDIKAAQTATQKFASTLQGFAMDMTLRFSLLSGLIVGVSSKLAIDFNKAMTETQRTTGLARSEIGALSQTFLELSKSLPKANAAMELAKISAIAGKAGISARGDVESFTIGMNKLVTVFDNLDADDATRKMVQIANAFHIPLRNVEWMGSVMSEIDNRTSATTSELITFSQVVAGIAQTVGFTYPEVVGLAGAIRDVGQRVETAATVFSQLFTRLATEPAKFAKTMHMTGEEFSRMVKEDASGALLAWFDVMSKLPMRERIEGLKELGLIGRRNTTVIMSLAENVDLLRRTMGIADDEAKNNTSLSRQWAVVNSSVAAGLGRLINQIEALAIEMGTNFFPVLEGIVDVFKRFIGALNEAPPFIKNFAFAIGAILTVIGPLSLLMGNVVILLSKMAQAFHAIAVAAQGTQTLAGFLAMVGTGNILMAAFAVTLVAGAAALALWMNRSKDAAQSFRNFANDYREMAKQRLQHAQEIQQLSQSAERLAKAEKLSNEQVAEKQRILGRLREILPEVVSGTDSFSTVLDRLKKKSQEAAVEVKNLEERLQSMSKMELMLSIRQTTSDLNDMKDSLKDALSGMPKLTKVSLEEVQKLIGKDFQDILKQPEWGKIDPFRRRTAAETAEEFRFWMVGGQKPDWALDFKKNAEQSEGFMKRLNDMAMTLKDRMFTSWADPLKDAQPLTNAWVNSLGTISELLLKIDKTGKDLQDMESQFEALRNPPPLLGGTGGKLAPQEMTEERIKQLQAEYDYALAVLNLAQEETRELKEQDKFKSAEEQQRYYEAITVKTKDALGTMRAGHPVVDGYRRALENLSKGLLAMAASSEEFKDKLDFRKQALQLAERGMKELTLDFPKTAKVKVAPTEDAYDYIRAMATILQLQRNEYANDLREADLLGLQDAFLAASIGRLEEMEDLHGEIAFTIERELSALTGVTSFAERGTAVIQQTLEAISDPEKRKAVLELLQLLRGLERGEGRTRKNDPFQDYLRELSEMGLTARNAFDFILRSAQNMGRRLADMLFDTRLTLQEIWEAMAKDALALFFEEIFKQTIGKGIGQLVGGLLSLVGLGGPAGDFLVRANGTVQTFSSDDNVVGFKSVAGLFNSILPAVVQPQFAMAGVQSQLPPQVTVNNKPPEVTVNIRGVPDMIRFQKESSEAYQQWQGRRRLLNR